MTADLGHLAGRVPDGQGHPLEDERRHQAEVAGQHLQAAAKVVVDALSGGDEGAARRFLHGLEHDPAQTVDPWKLAMEAIALALRRPGQR